MSELIDTLQSIRPLLDRAVMLATPPPDNMVVVTAGTNLQSAIDAAPAGSTLALEPGLYLWAGPLNKDMAFTTRRILTPGARATDADVTFLSPSGLLLYAPAMFRGIAHRCDDPTKNIIQALGGRFRLEAGVIRGGSFGARRGLRPEGDGGIVIDSTIDQCWRPGTEGQAVEGYDGGRNWSFINSYFGGASQSMMFGGGDSTSASRVVTNMFVSHCDFGKDADWFTKSLIKTAFEMKSGMGIHLSDMTFQGAGNAQGQHGFLIVLKSLNQDGHSPWTQTAGVLIENFTAKQGAAAISFVASDGDYPSLPLNNITIRNGVFSELDSVLYPGDAQGALMFTNRAAVPATPTKPAITEAVMSDITLENLKIIGQHFNASMYFIGPPPRRLILRNIQLPQSFYGVKIEGYAPLMTGPAIMAGIKAYAPDAIVENITVV